MFKQIGQIKEIADKVSVLMELVDKLKVADANGNHIPDSKEFMEDAGKAIVIAQRIQADFHDLEIVLKDMGQLAGDNFEVIKKALGIELPQIEEKKE